MLVYRYGLSGPTTNADRVFDQFRRAHTYRNFLTEIERERRKAIGTILEGGVQEAEATYKSKVKILDELRHKLRLERARGRSRRVEADALKTEIDTAKRDKNEALRTYKSARNDHLKLMRSERVRIDELALELRKGARERCEVYWGSYLLCEDADLAARKAPLFDGDALHLPRFLKWNGEGQLGVQIQKGMDVSQLDDEDETRLRIVPRTVSLRGEPWDDKRSPWGKLLRMRVGSTETGKPIFAEWPIKMHRPLPEHARIKRAVVTRALIGPREEWSLAITLDTSLSAPTYEAVRDGSAVAVDLGWRVLDDGNDGKEIRVCMYGDDHAKGAELRLSAYDIGGLTKASELRSVRDKELEVFKKRVQGWRAALKDKAEGSELIAEFLNRTNYVWSWRAAGRFARLVHWWRDHRLPNDAEMFLEAEAWRRQDKHLWTWECSQRTGALRHRKNTYRVFARKLASRYEWLVLEDFNIAQKVARIPEVEGVDTEQNERARSYRQLAAPSELRLCLIQAFGSGRMRMIPSVAGRTVITEGAFTTCTCHVCGLVDRFDAAKHLNHQCGGCGASWDQDENAWRNLVERWRVQYGGQNARIDDEAKYEGKWQRAKKKRLEREQSEATAREAPGNVAD